MSKNIVIVGAQWGDEGKGKLVDWLTESAQVVVRFQGGHNAGHTLVIEGKKTVLHLLPSGVMHPKTDCVIGNGVVLHLPTLKKEMDALSTHKVSVTGRLHLSLNCPLILPYHEAMDAAREKAREAGGAEKIGTTGRGIGPAYEDKVARRAIRLHDLMDAKKNPKRFSQKLQENVDYYNFMLVNYYQSAPVDGAKIEADFLLLADTFRPMVIDSAVFLDKARKEGKNILFEGAQGSLLDIDHGTYPFVTSSNTLAGNAACGSGVGPSQIQEVLGIIKAYITRVGGGPMPTELFDDMGKTIATRGAEFGATTGRPRRCGWFDVPLARRAFILNGVSRLAMMKLDVLDTLPTLKIATHYRHKETGERIEHAPGQADLLAQCEPVFEECPGWQSDTSAIRRFEDLPEAAQNYIRRIESLCERPIDIVSVHPDRVGTIIRRHPFET